MYIKKGVINVIDEETYNTVSNRPIKAPPYWPREGDPTGKILPDDENFNWTTVEEYFYLKMNRSMASILSIERVDFKKESLEHLTQSLPSGRERLNNTNLFRLLWYPSTENPQTIIQEGFKAGNKNLWGKQGIYFTNSSRAASRTCYEDTNEIKHMILARVYIGLSYQITDSYHVNILPTYYQNSKTYSFDCIFGRKNDKWYYTIFDKENAEPIYIVSFGKK